MVKIKLCGLSLACDIRAANELKPEYIGFVFTPKSSRYVSYEQAAELKEMLAPGIRAVGVFTDEAPERIAELLDNGVIDIAQLHGREDEDYIEMLRSFTNRPFIKAYRITADSILLDSGAGTGRVFDWRLIRDIGRPYFLAGGLSPDNVEDAITYLHPYAVDVSSGIETNGRKDKIKMAAFVAAVRKEERS